MSVEVFKKILLAVKRFSIYKYLGDPAKESHSHSVTWLWWWLYKAVNLKFMQRKRSQFYCRVIF